MAALDFDTDIPQNADPTAALSPDVAAMRNAQRMRAIQEAQINRQNVQSDLAATREQKAQQQIDIANSGRVMGNDALQWASNPTYAKQSWAETAPEARQHFIDAYGDTVAGQAPAVWNQAQRDVTGNPTIGLEQMPANSQAMSDVAGTKMQVGSNKTLGWQKPDEDLIKQHRAIGGSPIDENGQPKNAGQMAQEVQDYNTQHGILPEALANFQDAVTKQYQTHPAYIEQTKMAQGLNNFFSNYQQAIQNPNLANNMAVLDGFLRTQNPGGMVRQQTMNMYTNGQALLQKLTPEYLSGHLSEGQKLTSQFVKEAGDVMKREAQAQNDAFKGSVLKGFKTRLDRRKIPSDDLESPLDPILAQINQPAAQASQPQQEPILTTREQFDALPSGAIYVRNGSRYKKP